LVTPWRISPNASASISHYCYQSQGRRFIQTLLFIHHHRINCLLVAKKNDSSQTNISDVILKPTKGFPLENPFQKTILQDLLRIGKKDHGKICR